MTHDRWYQVSAISCSSLTIKDISSTLKRFSIFPCRSRPAKLVDKSLLLVVSHPLFGLDA